MFVCALVAACDDGTSPNYRVEVVDGDNQHGAIGEQAERPLTVRVLGSDGGPAAGVAVAWRVLEGGAGVRETGVLSDGEGLARTAATYGVEPGTALVLAEAGGVSVHFRLSAERWWRSVGAGLHHSCALSSVGEAYCWGGNDFAQLGDASDTNRTRPVPVSGRTRFASLALGWVHSCGLGRDGSVYCWGDNRSGQLGVGDSNLRHTPSRVPLNEPAVAVGAGYLHSCAVLRSGAAYCWGSNAYETLGTASTGAVCALGPCAMTPTRVAGDVRFVGISAGEFHTCAWTAEGAAYCWGWNSDGEVGTGAAPGEVYRTPARVHGSDEFREVVAHARHSCGVTISGAALCWGRNATGETGSGGWAPTQLAAEVNFRTISTGTLYTCATSADGRTICFGDQTGNSRTNAPRLFSTPAFTRVGVGFAHSCGAAASEVWCWGSNSQGQLGPGGTDEYQSAPVNVPLPN